MGYVIKNSIKSSIVSLTGAFLGFISIMIAVKYLDKVEFGFQQNLIKNMTLFSVITVFGGDLTLILLGQRFDTNHEKRSAFLRFTLLLSFIVIAIVVGLLIIFRQTILDNIIGDDKIFFEKYYYYFPLLIIIFTILVLLTGYYKSIYKSTYAFFMLDVAVRILMLVNIILFANNFYDFSWFVILIVTSYLIIVMAMIFNSNFIKELTHNSKIFLDKSEKLYVLKYAFIHLSIVLFYNLFFQIDTLLFPFLLENGLEKNAVYALGLFIVGIYRMPLRVLGNVTTPDLVVHYDKKDMTKIKELFKRSALNLQLLVSLLVLLWMVNMNSISLILNDYKSGYEMLNTIVPILLVGVWVEMSFGLSQELLTISKYAKANFWFTILSILMIIVLNIIMIKEWGILGAAYSYSIIMSITSLLRFIFSKVKLDINPFSFDSIKVIVLLSSLLLLSYIIPQFSNPWIDLVVRSITFGGGFVLLSMIWNIGEDLKNIYNKLKLRISK